LVADVARFAPLADQPADAGAAASSEFLVTSSSGEAEVKGEAGAGEFRAMFAAPNPRPDPLEISIRDMS
jgi:hypothetical protein